MSYQALARKYRPKKFAEVVGQTHVVTALSNALNSDRIHHAFLFTGTRGVGKTTLARIFAKALNCETNGVSADPCGACSACTSIDEGRFIDLVEVDAASRTKVEDTRELLDNVQYAPTLGRYKVYLIDEVHMLSNSSFNALLKTLEEPPPHVKFLLATTDPQKLPVTVLSRCLQFNLKSLSSEQISGQLAAIIAAEQIDNETSALHLLARSAQGSVRDALSLLDQAIAHGDGVVLEQPVRAMLGLIDESFVYDLLEALRDDNSELLFGASRQMAERSADFGQVFDDLLVALHAISMEQQLAGSGVESGLDDERIRDFASTFDSLDLQLYYQHALVGKRDLPYAPDPRTGFEMAMLRMLAFQLPNDSASAPTTGAPKAKNQPSRTPKPKPGKPQSATVEARAYREESDQGRTLTLDTSAQDSVNLAASETIEMNADPTVELNDAQASATAAPADAPPANDAPLSTNMPSAGDLPGNIHDPVFWRDFVAALKLEGAVGALAMHTAAQSIDNGVLNLVLAEDCGYLITETRRQALGSVIANRYPEITDIRVHMVADNPVTPVQINQIDLEAALDQAERNIVNDVNVRALQKHFDAQVIKETIQPAQLKS